MGSSFGSPRDSLNANSISGNSSASSSGKSKHFANSIAKVFRKSSSSQDEFSDPLLDDDEVDSQLQVELKNLMLAHEDLGQQASSLGAELATARAEAEALKSQLADATSRLTPSPPVSEAAFSPAATPTSGVNQALPGGNAAAMTPAPAVAFSPSPSPALVGSPFGKLVHEDVLALQTRVDHLTADIQTKDEAMKALESARATAATDAKILAIRCGALEITIQRLMESPENKDKADREEVLNKFPLSSDLDASAFNESSQLSHASDGEANIVSDTTEGMDTASSAIIGPDAVAKINLVTAAEKQKESVVEFSDTIPALHQALSSTTNNNASADPGAKKCFQVSAVGSGRFIASENENVTVPGANKKKLVLGNAASSVPAVNKSKTENVKKNVNHTTATNEENGAVKILVKGAAAAIVVAALSSFLRGGSKGSPKSSKA